MIYVTSDLHGYSLEKFQSFLDEAGFSKADIRKYAEKYVFISGKDKYKIVQCELMDNNVPVGAALYAKNGFAAI